MRVAWSLLAVCAVLSCTRAGEPVLVQDDPADEVASGDTEPVRSRPRRSASACLTRACLVPSGPPPTPVPAFPRPEQLDAAWSWPEQDVFARAWASAGAGAWPYALLTLRPVPHVDDVDDRYADGLVFASATIPAGRTMLRARAFGAKADELYLADKLLCIGANDPYTDAASVDCCYRRTLDVLSVDPPRELSRAAWGDRVYALGLLNFEGSNRPDVAGDELSWEEEEPYWEAVLAAMARGRAGARATKRALRRLLDAGGDALFDEAILYLEEHEPMGELLGRLYALETPWTPECDQDEIFDPIAGYTAYCARRRQLGCFAQLFVEAANSSLGHSLWHDDSTETPPIDHARFLLGTLWQFHEEDPGPRVHSPIRWAHAVARIGMSARVRPLLRERARDPSLDPLNRAVAVAALHTLVRVAARTPEELTRAELELVDDLRLHPTARRWIEVERASRPRRPSVFVTLP